MMDSTNDVLLACTIGDLTWLKRGLSNGIKPTAANKEGLNALHLAAKYGQLDCIKYLLDNCSIDVNCVALSTGSSALHYSIAHSYPTRSLQCTKLLLNRGGNHKCQNKIGETPLHVAAKYGCNKLVKLLLEKGADIQIKDKEGQTPYNTACVHNRHECARLLRALHWASKKDSDDRERLRVEETERRRTNAMLVLQERLRKEAADTSYNQWLEKKSKQEKGPSGPRERKPMTYARSTVSSRGASTSANVSAHKRNPQLISSIKVNPKQVKRNTASVGKPDKMQPYTNYPPKSASGSRSSAYFLGKSRSEPPRSGRTSRSTVRSAASVPAGVKYYSRMHGRQTTAKRDHQKQAAVLADSTIQTQTVDDRAKLDSEEAHGSEYDMAEKQEELHHEQSEEQYVQIRDLESRIDVVADQTVLEIDKEQVTATEEGFNSDNDGANLKEYNDKYSDEEAEGSDLYPHEKEEIDELDFSKLKENRVFNESTTEGDEDDLFHDVGQTNSLNALSLPNTLTKDRTPAEVIQLLRSFGGLSRSYNRSNSFSHDYSLAQRSRFQRRLSLGAIPEGQIVTNYNDEDQSSSQLLDEQFLESLIHSLSGDGGNVYTSKSMQSTIHQHALMDGHLEIEPESDDSETLSCGSNEENFPGPADFDEEQKSAMPKIEISHDDASPLLVRPQSLKIVNLAWDPASNTVHSHISESPLSPPDFGKMGGRFTPTRRLSPNNAQSHKVLSPTNSQASTHSQNSLQISFPSSPRYSPRDLSPSSSSSSVHSSRTSSPRSPSPSYSDVSQPSESAIETKAEDLKTRSLSTVHEEPLHTLSLRSMSSSMNSLSSKSMVMSSASYDSFGTVAKAQAVESKQAKKSRECRRVRSAPNIKFCLEQRSSQVLKTAVMEYGGTLRMS